MTDTMYAHKDRRGADGEIKAGPTHIIPRNGYNQSLCGRRIPPLSTWTKDRPETICPACLKHESAGTSGSWSRR